MGILKNITSFFSPTVEVSSVVKPVPFTPREPDANRQEIVMGRPMASSFDWQAIPMSAPMLQKMFSGEKDAYSIGPIIKYNMDNQALGQRSWQLYIEGETIHTVVNQKAKWVVGKALRLQSAPKKSYLKKKGVSLDEKGWEKLTKDIEELWDLASNKSSMMDYAGRDPFNKLTKRIYLNKSNWGDVLVIHRIDKNNIVTTQIVDGQWVVTPVGKVVIGGETKLVDNKVGYDWVWEETGNRVRNGVEIGSKGEHVAYWLRDGISLVYKRIPAKNRQGLLMAYLVYGTENRLADTRGIPETTTNMQSSKQLDEFTDAFVSSAVEEAKLTYFFTHEKGTEEKDPRRDAMAKIVGSRGASLDNPVTIDGQELANRVAATTKKMTFNLGEGTDVVTPESRRLLNYAEFRKSRFEADSATVGIPPEVASQLYGSSYSASRAATNGWQYMLNIDRDDFGNQLHQRVYNLQLMVWIMAGEIDAPGYLEAFFAGDAMTIAAWQYAEWRGAPVPQIDEKKEVEAIRLKLGLGSVHMPLTDFESACDALGTGDYTDISAQYSQEMRDADDLGIEKVATRGTDIENFDDPKEDDKGKPGRKLNDGTKG